MDKAEIKKQRKLLYKKIDALTVQARNGEDVEDELLDLGKQLDSLRPKSEHAPEPVRRATKFTDEQRDQAEANGISLSLLNQRVFVLGWSLEDAINKPIQHNKSTVEIAGLTADLYEALKAKRILDKEIADEFGVSASTLARFKKANGLNQKRELNPRNTKVREVGEVYRAPITVLNESKGIPTRVVISGLEYFMVIRKDNTSNHFNNARSRRKHKRQELYQNLNHQQAEGVKS